MIVKTVVVDTNVAIVANGRKTDASIKCQENCVIALEKIVGSGCIVVDDNGLIMDEYAKHLDRSGGPDIGDAFYRHIFFNQYIPEKVERVTISPIDEHGNFQEFPKDTALKGFDLSDRKFVAVALSSQKNPEILNAVDRGWAKYASSLSKYVKVKELC